MTASRPRERQLASADDKRASDNPMRSRTPPIASGHRRLPPPTKTRFQWFECDAIASDPLNRRRSGRFSELEAPKRLDRNGNDGRKHRDSPHQFIFACETGYLRHIEWRCVVHAGPFGEAGHAAARDSTACRLRDRGSTRLKHSRRGSEDASPKAQGAAAYRGRTYCRRFVERGRTLHRPLHAARMCKRI